MNTRSIYLILGITALSACSQNENNTLARHKDTPSPKSSLAELNENQSKNVLTWDGRIKGCKSKQ